MKKQIVFGMVAATAATSIFATANQVQAASLPGSTLNMAGSVQFDYSHLITPSMPPVITFPPVDMDMPPNSLTKILFVDPGSTIAPGGPALSSGTKDIGDFADIFVTSTAGPGTYFDSIAIGLQSDAIQSIESFGGATGVINTFMKLTGGSNFDFSIGVDKDGNPIANSFNLVQISPTAYDLDAVGSIDNGVDIVNASATFEITLQGLSDDGSLGGDFDLGDGVTGIGSFSGTIFAQPNNGGPTTPEPSFILGLGGVAVLGILSRKQKRQ